MDSSPLDQNCVNARNESVLLTAMSPVPNTVLGTQELKNSCQINELTEQKKKISFSNSTYNLSYSYCHTYKGPNIYYYSLDHSL